MSCAIDRVRAADGARQALGAGGTSVTLTCGQTRFQRGDFVRNVARGGERPTGASVPVARVGPVAFEPMYESMDPTAVSRIVCLGNDVGFLPVTRSE